MQLRGILPSIRIRTITGSVVSVIGLAIGVCAVPSITVAAATPTPTHETIPDVDAGIQMLRDEVKQDRREIVKHAMLLTQSESATFWPLYDEYRAQAHKLGDRRLKVIKDFAANQNSMSEDEAAHLTEESLSIQEDAVSLRQDYVKKMSKVLSARTVARFFQIDSKIDAVIDAELAANIPLIH
jgi:hypothetical protein